MLPLQVNLMKYWMRNQTLLLTTHFISILDGAFQWIWVERCSTCASKQYFRVAYFICRTAARFRICHLNEINELRIPFLVDDTIFGTLSHLFLERICLELFTLKRPKCYLSLKVINFCLYSEWELIKQSWDSHNIVDVMFTHFCST